MHERRPDPPPGPEVSRNRLGGAIAVSRGVGRLAANSGRHDALALLDAVGRFGGCRATTYWSARPVLALFPGVEVVPGYPRWHIDAENTRFSGGISSSIGLALKLVETIAGRQAAEGSQLFVQYAPPPPVHAGDPSEASPELVVSTPQAQASFTAGLIAAGNQVMARK